MGEQVARQVYGTGVLQAECALSQQQGRLKGKAVVAVVTAGRVFGYAEGVVGEGGGVSALGRPIPADAVVVQDGDARDCEQRA